MTDTVDTKAARAWLRDHGYEPGKRGRLSADLKAAYTERDQTPTTEETR